MLLAMGLLRLGFLANFLSHPVVAGFITASGLQIGAGQLAPVLGIKIEGETFFEMLGPLLRGIPEANPYTAAIGLGSLAFLFWSRRYLQTLLPASGSANVLPARWPSSGQPWRSWCPSSRSGDWGSPIAA
jgi:SulP family sulfate permease